MEDTVSETVGRRIAEERTALGMSQTLLATLAGLDRDRLNKIEHGVRGVKLEEALRIAAVLGLDAEDLQPRGELVMQFRDRKETPEAKEAEALFTRFIRNWEVFDDLCPMISDGERSDRAR